MVNSNFKVVSLDMGKQGLLSHFGEIPESPALSVFCALYIKGNLIHNKEKGKLFSFICHFYHVLEGHHLILFWLNF